MAVSNVPSVSPETLSKWRERFVRQGIDGLYDEYRSGRPRSIDDEPVAELISKTPHSKPEGATQWSTRDMAEQSWISKSTVHRVWSAYLNPPQNAVVLCVDEKSQLTPRRSAGREPGTDAGVENDRQLTAGRDGKRSALTIGPSRRGRFQLQSGRRPGVPAKS